MGTFFIIERDSKNAISTVDDAEIAVNATPFREVDDVCESRRMASAQLLRPPPVPRP